LRAAPSPATSPGVAASRRVLDGADEVATPYDTETMMRYDANKKSALLAYILWFLLGFFGVHRMYLGRVGSGIAMLVLHGLSWLTYWILIGWLGFAILGLWWLVDALLIPGITRDYNNRLVDQLSR
jgi:TM2 domain-containing membrane protein YozV